MQHKLEVRGDVGDFLDSVIRTSRRRAHTRAVMDTLNPLSAKYSCHILILARCDRRAAMADESKTDAAAAPAEGAKDAVTVRVQLLSMCAFDHST